MSVVALYDYDDEGFSIFFVVEKFLNDGYVAGKLLTPDKPNRLYLFEKETICIPIDKFEYGFDFVFYGETLGGIEYKTMPNVVLTNPHLIRRLQ